jgi:hypothetical protein
MQISHFKVLLTTLVINLLYGCASEPNKQPQKTRPNNAIALAEKQVIDLLGQVSKVSWQKHNITPVSHCRYEFTTQWSNIEKGYYKAQNKQRFSFTHDIRTIDHSPKYVLNYEDGLQYWDEMIELSFNRKVPSTFKFISTTDYRASTQNSVSDSFSLGGYKTAPRQLMEDLRMALTNLAFTCGNDVSEMNAVEKKLIGRWDIFGVKNSQGKLTVNAQTVTLQKNEGGTISGPFVVKKQGEYYRMIINPNTEVSRYHLLLDFKTSNYARLLLLGDQPLTPPFAPMVTKDTPNYNKDEKKLFRLGDLR